MRSTAPSALVEMGWMGGLSGEEWGILDPTERCRTGIHNQDLRGNFWTNWDFINRKNETWSFMTKHIC